MFPMEISEVKGAPLKLLMPIVMIKLIINTIIGIVDNDDSNVNQRH